MKKYLGYWEYGTLPIKNGQTIVIPKGVTVKTYTHPKYRSWVTKRCQKVKVHHLLPGSSIPDGEWKRDSHNVIDAPLVDTKWGKHRVLSNPCVVWAGQGGYWCEVDINDLNLTQSVQFILTL